MKSKTIKSKLAQGFSLVELLVVIAVIAVIAAIAIPNIQGTREAAVEAQTQYNQAARDRTIAQARAAGASTADITALETDGTVTFTPDGLNTPITFTIDDQ